MQSHYDDIEGIRKAVELGHHRDVVGGLWDELGKLQLDFMISEGLKPHHKLLDLGCGSLRGGIHFIRYLDPGNYFGADVNQSLLDAGYEVELTAADLKERLPRRNLICSGDFEVPVPDEMFDFGLAQSVFTHLHLNTIKKCFDRIARVVKTNAAFYVTFFELPDKMQSSEPFRHEPGGVVTYPSQDPYHYRFRDLQSAACDLSWAPRYIGGWGHPRGQKMAVFLRCGA